MDELHYPKCKRTSFGSGAVGCNGCLSQPFDEAEM